MGRPKKPMHGGELIDQRQGRAEGVIGRVDIRIEGRVSERIDVVEVLHLAREKHLAIHFLPRRGTRISVLFPKNTTSVHATSLPSSLRPTTAFFISSLPPSPSGALSVRVHARPRVRTRRGRTHAMRANRFVVPAVDLFRFRSLFSAGNEENRNAHLYSAASALRRLAYARFRSRLRSPLRPRADT